METISAIELMSGLASPAAFCSATRRTFQPPFTNDLQVMRLTKF